MMDEEVNDEPEQTEENVEEQVSEQPDGETVEGSPEAGEEAEAEAPAEEADDTETAGDEAGEEPVVEETTGEEAGGETAPAEAAGPARVLFLCTGNSCRSQMAEGLLRNLAPDAYESLSAGSRPAEAVHPMAIAVMQELEIDISAQQPKSIEVFLTGEQPAPNIVISVCAKASEECPAFTGAEVLSMSLPFDDPADAEGDDEEKLTVFRRVRDEIRETLQQALGL
ncbi:MAG: arsenate reductase ArsC [Planctomycetota bacterium]|nr:arsenate reductase ArsC [Planctomycetota bacterium]